MSAPTLAESPILPFPGAPELAHGEHSGHFLRWAGGAALGLATSYILDQEVGHRLLWNRPQPTITELPSDTSVSHHTATLFTCGFNSRPEATAKPLRRAFAPIGPVAMFHDSASCLNFDDNARTILNWAEETGTERLIMVGPSQGTMLNVAVAPALKAAGLDLALIAYNSPYGFADIQGGARRATLQLLSKARAVRGGPAMRFSLESLGYFIDNRGAHKSAKEVVAHSIRKIRDPDIASNAQCFGRAHFLVSGNLDPYMAQIDDVPFVYMGSANPADDGVVNNDTAYASYQAHHRQPIPRITNARVGHANPDVNPDAHRDMATRALRALDFSIAA